MSVKLPTVKVKGKVYSLLIVGTEPKSKRKPRPKQRYFLLDENKKLGEGAFGVVYEAYEAKPIFNGAGNLRSVSIRDHAKCLAIKIDKGCTAQNQRARLKQRKAEAKIQSKLFDTTVYPIENEGIATIMPKLPGVSLSNLIKTEKFKRLTLRQRLELAALIAQTYAEFHAKRYHWVNGKRELRDGLSHTDLKPDNFLINIRYAADDTTHDNPIFECNVIDFADLNAVTFLTTAPECIDGHGIECPLDHALEMETYSLTSMIALTLGETDVFKDKRNTATATANANKNKFSLNKMREYLTTKSKELNLEAEMKIVIDMVQSMQDDNPALRPSDLAIAKTLNRARLVILGKEREEQNDFDVDAQNIEEFFAAIKVGNLEYIVEKCNPELLAELDIEGLTALGVAIKYGKYDIAQYLLGKYSDEKKEAAVRQTDGNGRTLLHLAILAKNADLVKLLLENGADANERDADHRTPLNCAISMRCGLEIVKNLLDKGANIGAKDNHGRYPVEMAIAHHCDLDVVNHFLGKDIISIKDKRLVPPLYLHFAALGGNVAVAKHLIELGFDLNAQNLKGRTPLDFAARAGQSEMAKLLLQKGANRGEENIAKKKFHELTGPDGNTLLHLAIINDDIELAELLIASGAKVNGRNSAGMTPLHLATNCCNLKFIQLLLENNANPNIEDKSGRRFHERTFSQDKKNVEKKTLLHIAIHQGNVKLAKLLIANGADVNAKDHQELTPLHLATDCWNLELIQLLLEKKANPNIQDKDGKEIHEVTDSNGDTLLHRAIHEGKVELVKLLIASGAKVNTKNSAGMTPLHIAIREDNDDLAKRLIAMGADVNAKNSDGMTPLYLCAARGGVSGEMIKLLSSATVVSLAKKVSLNGLYTLFTQAVTKNVQPSESNKPSFVCRKLPPAA